MAPAYRTGRTSKMRWDDLSPLGFDSCLVCRFHFRALRLSQNSGPHAAGGRRKASLRRALRTLPRGQRSRFEESSPQSPLRFQQGDAARRGSCHGCTGATGGSSRQRHDAGFQRPFRRRADGRATNLPAHRAALTAAAISRAVPTTHTESPSSD